MTGIDLRYFLAKELLEAKDYSAALREARAVIEFDPTFALAYYVIAEATAQNATQWHRSAAAAGRGGGATSKCITYITPVWRMHACMHVCMYVCMYIHV